MGSTFQKKLRFYGTILQRNFVPGVLPYKAHLIVTWACQARCIMCDIWKRKPANELTLDEWTTFFQRNSFLKWLTFSGGEPFLRNDIAEIMEAAHRYCPDLYYVNTPTNSLATTKILQTVERILQIGIPQYTLSLSLDGPPDVHDRVRGVPGAWDKVMQVLRAAKELEKKYRGRFTVVMEHTLLPDSHNRFDEMVAAVRQHVPEITASDVLVATPNVSQHYYGNVAGTAASQGTDPALMESALNHIMETRAKVRNLSLHYLIPQLYLKMSVPYAKTRVPPMRCRATRSTIFIDPNGTVYPCSVWDKEIGDLRKSNYSLKELLAKPEIPGVRKELDRFQCGGCWTPCEAVVSMGEAVLRPGTLCRLTGAFLRTKYPGP